jgi:isopenicillin-N N-acyltransferase like protein
MFSIKPFLGESVMADSRFPFYTVKGAPREIGRQHGRYAKERIENCIDVYRLAFKERANIEWGKALEITRRFIPAITSYNEDALEEIKGIAEGAERDFLEILAVNCRSEIMYMQEEHSDGCTTVAVLPEASSDGHTLLGQNWDWRPSAIDSVILLHKEDASGLNSFHFVEAGMVGRNGMNAAGIGVVANYVESDRDRRKDGVPLPFIRHKILASREIYGAIEAIAKVQQTSSTNCIIGIRSGFAIDIETTPENFYPIYPTDGLIVHANHFQSPNIRELDVSKSKVSDSLYRGWRMERLLKGQIGKITVGSLKDALRDHFGYPRSICRHPEERLKKSDMMQTNASIVMDLNSGQIEIAMGCPCQSDYLRYSIEMETETDHLHGSIRF